MIESGDAEAIKVFEENNKVPMTIFQNTFSDEELTSVIKYLVEYKPEAIPIAEVTTDATNAPKVLVKKSVDCSSDNTVNPI